MKPALQRPPAIASLFMLRCARIGPGMIPVRERSIVTRMGLSLSSKTQIELIPSEKWFSGGAAWWAHGTGFDFMGKSCPWQAPWSERCNQL